MTQSWLLDPRRAKSEALAFQAEQAWAAGERARAEALFEQAANFEEAVAREVPSTSPRLRSVLAVSATALWYKAANFNKAKQVAYGFLADDTTLTKGGKRELEQLVERCSREAELREASHGAQMVPLQVKLAGGHVGVGIAPAKAAREKGRAVASLLIRSAELAANLNYREHGGSDLDRSDHLRIFEAPALAASYGLRFYVASGSKRRGQVVTPERVVAKFLELASAAASGPEAIRALVPDARYAQSFIASFGELAPDGEDIESVECSAPTWKIPNAARAVFGLEQRTALRKGLSAPPKSEHRRLSARVLAASEPKSTIELEVVGDGVEGPALETIEGTVTARGMRFLRGVSIASVIYDFDLELTRTIDTSGHTHVKLDIHSRQARDGASELPNAERAESRSRTKAALRWSKELNLTDALHNAGNALGYVQLTTSAQPIDNRVWFRRVLFADVPWQRGPDGTETAQVEFDVTLLGVEFGPHLLKVSHLASRIKHNRQPPTRLHWSGEVRGLLERNNFTGKYLVLEKDKAGHRLMIADEQPTAVP